MAVAKFSVRFLMFSHSLISLGWRGEPHFDSFVHSFCRKSRAGKEMGMRKMSGSKGEARLLETVLAVGGFLFFVFFETSLEEETVGVEFLRMLSNF